MSKISTNGRLIPAVTYLRCSTDEQTDASIPDQRVAVQEYADKHGYKILREYVDEGLSGDVATEDRHGFMRLLAHAQDSPDFQAILCWDQSRLGRWEPHEASYRTFPFKKACVSLVTCKKGPIDWENFTEWLTYSIEAHGDHKYL